MSDKPAVMSSSDFNLEKLTTPELSEHIAATINIGGNIAIFGRRGVGKTQIAKQQIKKSELHELYINLSVFERVDLGGYPNIMAAAEKKKFVDFILPQFYQTLIEPGKGAVLMLDEMDKADPSLWAPLLELTQFRTMNGRALPNLKAIIMTGNLISEGGQRPSLPLLDRSEKFLLEADSTSWLSWAGAGGHIHPSITAYINDHPKDLFGSIEAENDSYADSSPRGWHRASDILRQGEERGWSSSLLNKKVCGCVGKSVGIKYSNYYEHYQQLLPMIDDIFNGKDVISKYNPLEPTKKLVACMITCARLATQLDTADKKKPLKSIESVGRFLSKVSYENVLVAVRSQIQINRLVEWNLDEHPEFKDVLAKINKSVDAS